MNTKELIEQGKLGVAALRDIDQTLLAKLFDDLLSVLIAALAAAEADKARAVADGRVIGLNEALLLSMENDQRYGFGDESELTADIRAMVAE